LVSDQIANADESNVIDNRGIYAIYSSVQEGVERATQLIHVGDLETMTTRLLP
jgi:hypothetical protein